MEKETQIAKPVSKDQALTQPIGYGGYNNKEIAILKATAFSQCKTMEQIAVACQLAKTYGLDPFAQELWAIMLKDRMIIQASASGWRKIIRKSKDYQSGSLIINAVFANDKLEIDFIKGEVSHTSNVMDIEDGEDPKGAYCQGVINGKRVVKYVRWSEYAKKDGYSPWGKQKSEMICAKASAIFGRTYCGISGLYSEGEIEEDDQNEPVEERFKKRKKLIKKSKKK